MARRHQALCADRRSGTRDIEAERDSYPAQLDTLRLPEFIQTVQDAYGRIANEAAVARP